MNVLNLTQHAASAEQKEQKIIDVNPEHLGELKDLLTFNELPSRKVINQRAESLASLAEQYQVSQAMIGGAPFLMSALEEALNVRGIEAKYAFSMRVSMESTDENGVVTKTAQFKHIGLV